MNSQGCRNYEIDTGATEEDYITIKVKDGVLNNILSKVTITKEPKVIPELSCKLVVENPPPIYIITSLVFEGSMKYDQKITKQETVKNI